MKAYWFDNQQVRSAPVTNYVTQIALTFPQGDQREEHNSGYDVDAKFLANLGVLYYHCPSVADVDVIASERSYNNRDEIIVSPEKMGSVGGCEVIRLRLAKAQSIRHVAL